jgi:predicted nuclease of restriction endonuclease-like (RecB) superfamily
MTGISRKPSGKPGKPAQDFTALVEAVRRVHNECAAAVNRTVNTTLTLRNWLIGGYIHHYELNGSDRAQYGERLMDKLAEALRLQKIPATDRQRLYAYMSFYRTYPQIAQAVPQGLHPFDTTNTTGIFRSVTGKTVSAAEKSEIVRSATVQLQLPAEKAEPKLAIRDPYIFEFLGLKASESVSESSLEDALLDNLHEFLMELGHGFCLEARQKSIVIGKTRGFVDLVFYHRILKCHVLIELKVDTFSHEHLGQLNTYVSWYRKHMMTDGDNSPVGLLLCTQKDHTLVEYATANMDNRLFVSKYQLELPTKEELERFLQDKRREITEG